MPASYEPTCRQLHIDSWPHDKPIANLRFGTDIPRGDVRWLWPGRIPLGRLTLLVGDPGVGKSLLLADIAARHSAGLPFPSGTNACGTGSCGTGLQPVRPSGTAAPVENRCHQGGVLFLSPEDGLSATLQPRLVAAGATLRNILAIDGLRSDKYNSRADLPFTLPEHFDLLEDALRPLPAPRLVVLDPFSTLLSSAIHPGGFITVLRRLSLFAAGHDAAVILVAHLVKAGSLHVLYRVRGSLTLTGAVRSALLLSHDPLHGGGGHTGLQTGQTDRRILSVIKSVYAAPPPPLAFDIKPGPRVEWQAAPEDVLSGVALHSPLVTNSPEVHSALTDACAWLLDFLAGGPRDVQAIHAAAARDGHTAITLRRAKNLMALGYRKPDNESAWQWYLPKDDQPTDKNVR